MKSSIAMPFFVLLTACAGPAFVSYQPAPTPLTIPIVPAVSHAQTFFLENGLEVLAVHNPGSPMVGLNLLIRIGSAYEDYSTSGMSHMLEHLLFNGTVGRTQSELYEEVDFYGAYSNAHTDMFYTNFIFLIPAGFLEEGMDIQTDMVFNSILPNEKFDKERGIVMEEIRKDRDRKQWAINNAFKRMNYGSAGVGMPTIGTLNTIEHLSRDETYEFYKTHYVPNNMVLTILGNFDPGAIKDQLEQYYGKLRSRPIKKFTATTQVVKPGQVLQATGAADKIHGQVVFEAPTRGAAEQLSYEIFATLFNQRQDETEGADAISVVYEDYPGSGRLIFSFKEDVEIQASAAFNGVVGAIKEADANLGTLITAEKIRLMLKQEMVEEIALLDQPHYYGMLKAGNLAFMSAAESMTRFARISALSADEIVGHLKGFSNRAHQFNLFMPEAANATPSENAAITINKTVLPSGATLITRTSGGSEMFGMHILIKNRHKLEGDLNGSAELLHGLLKSGTPQYTAEQIKDELAARGATLKAVDMGFIPYDDYYDSADYGYIRFECLTGDAQWGIRFITHLMENTKLTEEKFARAHSAARRRISMKKSTALHRANQAYNDLLLGEGHPFTLAVSGTSASMEIMDLAGLETIQRRYFRPENYIITISSPLPHATLVNAFNGVWRSIAVPVARAVNVWPTGAGKSKKLIDLGKEQAQIRLGYGIAVAPEDKAALNVMTSILSHRMIFDLRETRGLAYSLSIRGGTDGDADWITASMGTGVDQIDEALAGIKSYFKAARLNDVTQQEIDKTVNALKGRTMMRNLTRLGQAYTLGYHEFYDGDYRIAMTQLETGGKITPADVKRVARKYLKLPENYTQVIVK